MIRKYNNLHILLALLILVNGSCKKDWLEKKQDTSTNVPSSLKDVQELIQSIPSQAYFNSAATGLCEIGTDDIIAKEADINIALAYERNHYVWKRDCYEGSQTTNNWSATCEGIYVSNLCIGILGKIPVSSSNKDQWERLKGQALFYRAYGLFDLSQAFCKPYDIRNASVDLGLPIPLEADINVSTNRLSLKEVYDRVIEDLTEAAELVRVVETERNTFCPGKAAIEGMLARVYLSMKNYPEALKHSGGSLMLYSQLNDYNTVNAAITYPFVNRGNNVEILSHGWSNSFIPSGFLTSVPDELYKSYDDNDLRKKIFFRNSVAGTQFRGSYFGSIYMYTGLTTDEVYLINAECKVRTGDILGGISKLNQLLRTRYDKNSNGGKGFQDYVISDPTAALDLVLAERRKELFRRGLRWGDLRRLNTEPRYAKTITKTYGGKTYSLPPNDINYTLQIPPFEVNIVPNVRHDIIGQ